MIDYPRLFLSLSAGNRMTFELLRRCTPEEFDRIVEMIQLARAGLVEERTS